MPSALRARDARHREDRNRDDRLLFEDREMSPPSSLVSLDPLRRSPTLFPGKDGVSYGGWMDGWMDGSIGLSFRRRSGQGKVCLAVFKPSYNVFFSDK